MATNMKTIKFGENGETYAVNAPVVQVSGELEANAEKLDFGSFDGVTDLYVSVKGVSDTSGTYSYVTINGVKSGFISRWDAVYKGNAILRIKKIGAVWMVFFISGYSIIDSGVFLNMLKDAESITSLSIECYAGTPFAAGTKYTLEGR